MRSTILVAACCAGGFVGAQRTDIPTQRIPTTSVPTADAPTTTIDVNTRWSFRSLSPVTVSSTLVRLGDVVRPVDPKQSGWDRMRRKPIGLVPVDGRSMTIRRDRLHKIILNAEATPQGIQWLGPELIHIEYKEETNSTTADQMQAIAPEYARGETEARHQAIHGRVAQTSLVQNAPRESDAKLHQPLPAVDAERVIRWIELGIQRFFPDLADAHAIEVPSQQLGLVPLRYLGGVTAMEQVGNIDPQTNAAWFLVTARSVSGPIEAEIQVKLEPHPRYVVTRRSLGRGHRIEEADLELKPFPVDSIDRGAIADIRSLVGQEARTTLRTGQPILSDHVGSPILIHRGDLIEVRVIGGGVSVTTNAKALGDGAESDLIEIETMNPRKRLVARVARTGLVEIVTRAPKVR